MYYYSALQSNQAFSRNSLILTILFDIPLKPCKNLKILTFKIMTFLDFVLLTLYHFSIYLFIFIVTYRCCNYGIMNDLLTVGDYDALKLYCFEALLFCDHKILF